MEVKGLIGRSRKTAPFLLSLMTRARAPKTTIKLFLKMLQFCLSYSILHDEKTPISVLFSGRYLQVLSCTSCLPLSSALLLK